MRVVGFALLGLVGLLALWLGAAFAMQAWHTYLHALRVTVEVETPRTTGRAPPRVSSTWW